MEKIVVVRAVDPDGTIFQRIMAALCDKSIQTVEVSSSVRSFDDVEIYPASQLGIQSGISVPIQ